QDCKIEKVPYLSVCYDLKEYVNLNKLFPLLPEWQTRNFSFKLKMTEEKYFNCFRNSYIYGGVTGMYSSHKNASNWKAMDYYKIVQQLFYANNSYEFYDYEQIQLTQDNM